MYVHKYNHIIVEFQEENRYNINGHKIRLILGNEEKIMSKKPTVLMILDG